MMVTTKSTVTITMTGVEANDLAVWMNDNGAVQSNGVQSDLLLALRDLPVEELE